MRPIAILFLFLVPFPAAAQGLSTPEAATLPRLIDSLCVDLHEASGCELAILLESESEADTADLVILPDRRNRDDTGPLLVQRGAAFNGTMWGMSPSLEAGENDSLLLHSEQSGIGRHPWFQTLTIGWHEGAFHVLRFEQSTYDRFSSSSFACTVDFRNGDWQADATWVDPETGDDRSADAQGNDAPGPRALSELPAFASVPAPCRPLEDLYFQTLP